RSTPRGWRRRLRRRPGTTPAPGATPSASSSAAAASRRTRSPCRGRSPTPSSLAATRGRRSRRRRASTTPSVTSPRPSARPCTGSSTCSAAPPSPSPTVSTASRSPACSATRTPPTSASTTAGCGGPTNGSSRPRASPRRATGSLRPTAPAPWPSRARTSAPSACSNPSRLRIDDGSAPQIVNRTSEIVNPLMRSFLDVPSDSPFSLHNLPYGVFTRRGHADPRVGVAVGDHVLDLAVLAERDLLDLPELGGHRPFHADALNDLMALSVPARRALRTRLQRLLRGDEAALRDDAETRALAIVPRSEVRMRLPARI